MKCFYCGFENPENIKYCGQCGNVISGPTGTSSGKDADIDALNQLLFPKFLIEKKIGKGGMATVYLGEQTALQRKIVVKILNIDISSDEEIRERFLLEARTPA
ncbi:MAG TPA: protein kinase family protein, partial [Leptospiraceae bacterium]|nr:protein kinase family protein [Leptospiraceae bacterium]